MIVEPSRTLRALLRLAAPKQVALLEYEAPEALKMAALEAGTPTLVMTGISGLAEAGFADELRRLGAAVLLLARDEGEAARQGAGLAGLRWGYVPVPFTTAAVAQAVQRLGWPGGAGPTERMSEAACGQLRKELEGYLGEELRKVAWRILPELAEKIIREELERLLAEEESRK